MEVFSDDAVILVEEIELGGVVHVVFLVVVAFVLGVPDVVKTLDAVFLDKVFPRFLFHAGAEGIDF